MPLIDCSFHYTLDEDGVRQVVTVPPDTEELARASFKPDKIEELMAHFDFTSLLLKTCDQVSHVVECAPTVRRVSRGLYTSLQLNDWKASYHGWFPILNLVSRLVVRRLFCTNIFLPIHFEISSKCFTRLPVY
ncbi:unnamed protein product [Taenia asiatica]|uniref:DIOX_N domain-containing protein n=1 Tax=Taenia asiatica TaxID=60517 RepID=A0A0R3W0G3_TAEAS|nr:unnamed protein product [Taenia asiatica]